MISNERHTLGQIGIVRDDDPALAGVNCLVIVEAEYSDMCERSSVAVVVRATGNLRGVLDHDEIALARDLHDLVHFGGMTKQIDDNDRFRVRAQSLANCFRRDAERLFVDVRKNGNRAIYDCR
jgi:hypothetical protein